jgi:hypothetical protein
MDAFDWEETAKCIEENLRQAELDKAALATNDDAVIKKRLEEAWEWEQTSPYGARDRAAEKADALAKKLYGKPFSEMEPDEFEEPE